MIVIPKPNINKIDVYNTCCSRIGSVIKKQKLQNCLYTFLLNSIDYDNKALNQDLHLISRRNLKETFPVLPIYKNDCSNNSKISLENIKDLYEFQMVPEKKPARKYYDKIMSLAPSKICPFCGFGEVSTLDHYLPKAKFPIYSVLPYNLIPACKDCNKKKLADFPNNKNEQTIHPYYDDFSNDQWIYAKVIKGTLLSMNFTVVAPSPGAITVRKVQIKSSGIEFYVNSPSHWDSTDKKRVEAHFKNFLLNERFPVQATTILAMHQYKFSRYQNPNTIRVALREEANSYRSISLNSWQYALFQALSADSWYYSGGFKYI